MNMLNKIVLGAAMIAGLSGSAQAYVFGYSGGAVTLSTDAGDVTSSDTGWYTQSGFHYVGNSNYIADVPGGDLGEGYNDYFTFDFSNFNGTINSAALTLFDYDINGSYTFRLGAYSGSASALYDGTAGAGTYNQLGSGTFYGSRDYTSGDGWVNSSIALNAAALAGINAAIANHGTFTIGGTVAPSSPAPEPASWAMMVGGFGLVGGAMRARRKAAAVSFA